LSFVWSFLNALVELLTPYTTADNSGRDRQYECQRGIRWW